MFGPGPGAILHFSVLQLRVHLQERVAAELKEAVQMRFQNMPTFFLMVKKREKPTRRKKKEDKGEEANSFIVHLGQVREKRRNKLLQIR